MWRVDWAGSGVVGEDQVASAAVCPGEEHAGVDGGGVGGDNSGRKVAALSKPGIGKEGASRLLPHIPV